MSLANFKTQLKKIMDFIFINKNSVSYKVFIAVVMVSSISTVISSAIQISTEYKEGISRIKDNLEMIRFSFLDSLSNAVWNIDEKQIKVTLSGIQKIPSIEYIEVQSNTYKVSEGVMPKGEIISRTYEMYNSSQNGDPTKSIGSLKVVATLNKLISSLFGKAIVLFFAKFIEIMIISLMILFVMRQLVIRHLGSITSYLKELGQNRNAQNLVLTRKRSKNQNDTDEFDILVEVINAMKQEISKSYSQIEEFTKNLERIVEERTITISTILSNVKCGFLLINDSLVVQDGFTKYCESIFGSELKAGADFSDILKLSIRDKNHFQSMVSQVFEDILDEEFSLSQIPKRCQVGETSISLVGSAVRDKLNNVKAILITAIDATELDDAEKNNKINKLLVKLLSKKSSFQEFVIDAKEEINLAKKYCREMKSSGVRGIIHTLKGNIAAFGFEDLAIFIHQIEENRIISEKDIEAVEQKLRYFLKSYSHILNVNYDDEKFEEVYTVNKNDLEELSQKIQQNEPPERIKIFTIHWLEKVKKRTVSELIGSTEEYVKKLAERLGKKVRFELNGGDIKIDPQSFKTLFHALIHMIRNSIDHGLEMPKERIGKPEEGKITLQVMKNENQLTLKISDDGRGLPMSIIEKKALDIKAITPEKLKSMSFEERCQLIFLEGLSTKETASEISGRGIGMSAVLETVLQHNGKIHVKSQPNIGTEFEIILPIVNTMFVN